MLLPPSAQQTIDQIIAATDDVTPELSLVMQRELTAQLEALVFEQIEASLTAQNKHEFNQLISQDSPDPQAVNNFISQNVSNFDQILQISVSQLSKLYLD